MSFVLMASDTIDANFVHVTQRDVAFAAVSRAPMSKIKPFQERMGWRFPWVSAFGSDFNHDFAVSLRRRRWLGVSSTTSGRRATRRRRLRE